VQNKNKMTYRSQETDDCFTLHKPVLLKQIISIMDPCDGDVVIDCTSGLGGHAEAFLDKIGENGTYVCIDQDPSSLSICKNKMKTKFPNHKIVFINDNFKNIKNIIKELNIEHIDHLIADFGISSYQLDTPERGFSFKVDGPLDMRMNQNDSESALNFINNSTSNELAKVLREYGEIPYKMASKVSKDIIKNIENINTTNDLREIITNSIPKHIKKNLEPLVFQAIRIEINDELESIRILLKDSFEILNTGTKLGFISFHSLEDRIVKKFLKYWSKPCICPKTNPVCTCQKEYPKRIKLINKKIVIADEDEIEENPRARSAKLRVAQIV